MHKQIRSAAVWPPSWWPNGFPYRTPRYRLVLGLVLCLFLAGVGSRHARVGWAGSRPFYLAVYDDRLGKYGDFAFTWVGAPAPAGKKIILQINPDRCYPEKYGQGSSAAAWLAEIPKITDLQTAKAYLEAMKDWNGRPYFADNPAKNAAIYAICVDEPFWDYNEASPCGQDNARLRNMRAIRTTLDTLAQAVHELAPNAFFWVNYSRPEVDWMQVSCRNDSSTSFSLNSPRFDVVSMDFYANNFNEILQKIEIVRQNQRPGQQLALIASARKDAGASTDALTGMLQYAHAHNQHCRLDAGRGEPVGVQKRCPVFLVAAWNVWGWPEAFFRDHPQNANNTCLQPCTSEPGSCVTGIWGTTLALPVGTAN